MRELLKLAIIGALVVGATWLFMGLGSDRHETYESQSSANSDTRPDNSDDAAYDDPEPGAEDPATTRARIGRVLQEKATRF